MSDYWHPPVEGYLRSPPNNLARSAYAVEVNPWSRKGEIESALLFRGAIVSAYGYIDTRLSELAVRTSVMPEYTGLRDKLPFVFQKRINYLREIFNMQPLGKYQPYAELFLARLERYYGLRNFMAHARMQVLPDWGVTFTHFKRGEDNELVEQKQRVPLEELERMAWRLSRLSRLTQFLLDRIEREGLLPSINEVS